MTERQYEKLEIDDLVTRFNGPNKDIVLRVTSKYSAIDGTNCLSAMPVNADTNVYVQDRRLRGKVNTLCGAASCFKVLGGAI